MITVFTFPGQGAQRPGMFGNLPEDPGTADRLAEASEVLQQDIRSLDTQEAFGNSRNVQLALLISGVVWGEYLLRLDVRPEYVLGLSIGAYPAAVLSGCMEFEDALHIVDLRGSLMQRAYPSGYGMMALTGPTQSEVEKAVHSGYLAGQEVYLANINGEGQFVLAGKLEALVETEACIRSRVPCSGQLLQVPVPSHCELLDSQADALSEELEKVQMARPNIKYVSPSAARVLHNVDDIRSDLARNMSRQMRWYETSMMLVERGLERAIEMPPGSTLSNLFRRAMPSGVCVSASEIRP
ncbi:MAG: malonate decarboxylase subunit epsilon [Marinobacter sp.]|nr:malonate decarboxylase subunit epsilon [Marinobacter sp.]